MGKRASRVERPKGLTLELLDVDGEELAVFTWEPELPVAPSTLTQAEHEVLRLVASGASNAKIATNRGTSARTVANQIASLLRKLGSSSRFDLIRRFGVVDEARRSKG